MAKLTLHNAGMHTLLQDIGRLGVADAGLSQGGAADLHSFCWANYLLANPTSASQLEIVFGQLEVSSDDDIYCVLTGADCRATIGSEPIKAWQTFVLPKGERLKLGYPRAGLRTYFAVQGGFDVPMVKGSCSTVVRNQIGGLVQGQPLVNGDVLLSHTVPSSLPYTVSTPNRFIPDYAQPCILRVYESYQASQFSAQAYAKLYQSTFILSAHSDRMGCRLKGESIIDNKVNADGRDSKLGTLISEGIAYGAIQITPDGLPIVMMNDRQTLGGYPKMGCVARKDMAKLAQSPPGTPIMFQRGDMTELSKSWWQFSRFFGLPI
ncbi:allophanate hydrolase [Photobacterium jeanii]|uniref:Allophanate hydrolase n=1 Tax=Photobacterium jeanii TaxID=858640 RepID=A0A178KAR1_9GAMM|nr:biotin-dependent carboxyltransferase family protein [Photobacterium jeanii]OAN13733.1 allophanate hydrolase [Photobacterium jeanii]PST88855.1 allophanate hydrolase [Photobacterium jeanii]